MRNRVLAALAGLVALGVCITASAAPIEAYSRLPAMESVHISDDGSTIAYINVQNAQQRVIVQQLDGTVLAALDLGEAKVRGLDWAGPDYVVVSVSTTSTIPHYILMGELSQAVSLNVRTGEAQNLMARARGATGYLNVNVSSPVFGTWDGEPVAYVSAFTAQAPWRLDLIRVDLEDGDMHQQAMGAMHTQDFLALPDGTVLAQEDYDPETTDWSLKVRVNGAWRTVRRRDVPLDRPHLGGLTSDGGSVIVSMWDAEQGVYRPTPLSLQTGEFGEPILPPIQHGIMYDTTQRMMGHVSNDVYLEYVFSDPQRAATWQRVSEAFPDRQVSLESHTPDFSKIIVYVEGTGFVGNYILFDAASGRFTQIGRTRPELTPQDIAEVRSITYRAADGLEIQGYLTLPPGREARNLPVVVLPHGGPQSRDYAGFDWMAQSLASRGYAVLQPNFRGSSGFGNAFVEAAYGQWGRTMQTDVSDGVAYLAGRGIVDPSRACIMGASYGGYAALAGVTLQSGVYRCAVAIAPVADPHDLLEWIVSRASSESTSYRYWQRYIGFSNLGDPMLNDISPLRHAGNASAPILLIHGRDDTVVPFSHSADMERALRGAGKPVELVTLRQEDHWLSREATRIQTMTAAIAFIERNNPPN